MLWRTEKKEQESKVTVAEVQDTIGSVAKNLEDSLVKLDYLLTRLSREKAEGSTVRPKPIGGERL